MFGIVFIMRSIHTDIDKSFNKCIFADEIDSVPNVGHKIEVQGMVVMVNEVIHNFNEGYIEFHVDGSDENNDFKEINFLK